jgi:cytidyltransferase-like protein
MNDKKIGFTIGKFAPLHKGHQFLIETALKEMDEFYVVVYETDKININIEKRAEWIKTLYPNVNILYAEKPPMKYGIDGESVKIQMEYLSKIIKDIKLTHFYSSEVYGKYVAEYLNIENRQIDKERINYNISATKILKNIEQSKEWLNEIVYNDLKMYK